MGMKVIQCTVLGLLLAFQLPSSLSSKVELQVKEDGCEPNSLTSNDSHVQPGCGFPYLLQFFLPPTTCTPLKNCGIPNHQTKIVGGKETEVNEYPWMVSLHRSVRLLFGEMLSTLFCGGTLISSSYVLTAAHCVYAFRFMPLLVTVNIGGHDLISFLKTENQQIAAVQIIVHPSYSPPSADYDIALIKLIKPVKFRNNVRVVCLHPPIYNLTNKMVTATGWGRTAEGGSRTAVLNAVTIPTVPNSDCQAVYDELNMRITPRMLCAGISEGGKDTCQGDSGGPLVYKNGKRFVIVGIVSFGFGCAKPAIPGVYTRVSEFIPWIQEIVGNNTCYQPGNAS